VTAVHPVPLSSSHAATAKRPTRPS
jgi:hypothetical protein